MGGVQRQPTVFRPLFRSPDGLQTVSVDRTNQLFGQLRISDRPRIMQFALKYFFLELAADYANYADGRIKESLMRPSA